MDYKDLDHWPFRIYRDDLSNLFIQDREERLIFVRGKLENDKYDLGVIIEDENNDYWIYTDSMSPEPPYGFQLIDEMPLEEWNKLSRDYLRQKRKGEEEFNKWIKSKLWIPLGKALCVGSYIIESLPHPDDPESEKDKYRDDLERRENNLKNFLFNHQNNKQVSDHHRQEL